MEPPENNPNEDIIIGYILDISKRRGRAQFEVQYYGNNTGFQAHGKFLPGWISKNGTPYYSNNPSRATHKRFTNKTPKWEADLNTHNLLFTNITLTSDNLLDDTTRAQLSTYTHTNITFDPIRTQQ